MGGKAFSASSAKMRGHAAINCARVSSTMYPTLLSRFTSILQPYFESLTSPTPAPGKLDHGDIDILAYGPKYPSTISPLLKESERYHTFISTISTALNATATLRDRPTTNFAIPIGEGGEHVQLDVHVCPTREYFDMIAFNHAYGDTWNILNTCARYAGLSANADGLRMIIEHDPTGDGRKSLLVLTRSPRDILRFWGLDVTRWYRGFDSRKELFDYLATNRFLRMQSFEKERLIYRDRRRMGKREMFDNWVEEYIPSRPDLLERGERLDMEEIKKEALETFGKQEEYGNIMKKIEVEKGEKGMWADVATRLRDREEVKEEEIGVLTRALKKVVVDRHGEVLEHFDRENGDDVAMFLEERKGLVNTILAGEWKEQLEQVRRTKAEYEAKKAIKPKKTKVKVDGPTAVLAQAV